MQKQHFTFYILKLNNILTVAVTIFIIKTEILIFLSEERDVLNFRGF